jgi:uncharacterized membrane protein YtjA (UPF0391 family)
MANRAHQAQLVLKEKLTMRLLAAVCFAIAIIAALCGFRSVFNFSWEGPKILCFVFFVLAALSFLVGGWRRRTFVG